MNERHDDGVRHDVAGDSAVRELETLERWLEAEAAGHGAAAEAALTALFAALPAPWPSPALSARLAVTADAGAERQRLRRTAVLGMPRRLIERIAASLLLLVGLAAAAAETLFRDAAGPALVRLRPAHVLSSAAEMLFRIVSGVIDGAQAAADVLQDMMRLSGAAATVVGSVPIAVALGAALLLAVFAFKLLRDLIGTERGLSHVEHDG